MPVRIRETKLQPPLSLPRRQQVEPAAALGRKPPESSVPNTGASITACHITGMSASSPARQRPAPESSASTTSCPDIADPKLLTYRSRRPGLPLRQSFRHLCPGLLRRLHNVAGPYGMQSLQNPEFYYTKLLTTIEYHGIPCSPMDGCSR